MFPLAKNRSLAWRIALAAFLVATAFGSVIAGIGIFMTRDLMSTIIEGELNHKWTLISKTIEAELERALADAEDMARNPVVRNALLDSRGRDAYLRPYVAGLRTKDSAFIRISIHDYSGAALATNRAGVENSARNSIWRSKVLAGEKLVLGPDADGHAHLIVPVDHPATRAAVGFVWWEVDLGALLDKAAQPVGVEASVTLSASSGGAVAHFGRPFRKGDIEFGRMLRPSASLSALDLVLSVRTTRDLMGIPLSRVILFTSIGALVVLIAALIAARFMGRRIATPIVQLSRIASAIDPDRPGQRLEIPEGDDEVALLGRSFVQMVERLQLSYETLENRVRERTAELEAAQEASEDQASRIHSIVDNIADGIITMNADGVIESANAAAERIFGYAATEMLGRNFKMLMQANYSGAYDNILSDHRETGMIGRSRELEGQRSNGVIFPMELAVSRISDKGRNLYTGVVRDISERREAEARLRESQAHMDRAQELAGLGSWEWTPDLDSISVSESMRKILGVEETDTLRKRFDLFRFIHPADRWTATRKIDAAIEGKEVYEDEHRVVCPDGSVRIVEESGQISKDPTRNLTRLLVTTRDITEVKKARDDLRLAASVFEATVEAIVITDCEGLILTVNGAFEDLTGFSPASIEGKALSELWADDEKRDDFEDFRRRAMAQGRWQGEFTGRKKDGNRFIAWGSISVVRDSKGLPARLVVVLSDITDLRSKDEHIRHQAFHDALTNLPNRALLRDRLERSIISAQRSGKEVAVMFLDLDRFKLINDSLGHDAGDQLLVTVADRLKTCLRKSDTIARLGGDEFVVLIDDFEFTGSLGTVAEKIIRTVTQPIVINGHDLQVSTSIGIAVFPENGKDVEAIMRNADVAMYQAKEAGRNCYRVYHADMNSRSAQRLEMENAMRRALEREEFELHYQPKLDIVNGQPCGLEALIRWRHPTKGLVPPGEFIPVAEESGLIIPISEWVIGEACRQLKEWRLKSIPVLPVAINIAARQFRDPDFVEKITKAVSRNGLEPRMLELEITESTAMARDGKTMAAMNELRRRGHALMVDDFGTGYSSLSYLRQLPISGLKIDRSFVDGLGSSAESEAIAEAVLGIAEALHLEVVAEGIETSKQAKFLVEKGCRIGQGFLYARPMPCDACADWLQANAGTKLLAPNGLRKAG